VKPQRIRVLLAVAFEVALSSLAFGQALPADIKAKAEKKIAEIKIWAEDPQVVRAVQAYNSAPPTEAREMTNDNWKGLTVLDPKIRAYCTNALAEYFKSKRDESVSEVFVSGADGGKVAFLAKPTSWSHKGKPKHDIPMSGKIYIGPIETDESSGQEQVQIGVPVLAGGKPVGSIVVGFKVRCLR
jgi:hypothetical protein